MSSTEAAGPVGSLRTAEAPEPSAAAGPAASVIGAARAAVETTYDQPLWQLTDDALAADVDAAFALRAQADAVLCARLVEAHTRELSKRRGFRSLPAWLRAEHRIAPGEASVLARTAVGLAERVLATGRALAGGAVSFAQARVIDEAIIELAKDLPEPALVAGEALLLEQAAVHDPAGLAAIGQQLHQRLDPAGWQTGQDDRLDSAERGAFAERGLTLSRDRIGSGSLIRGTGWVGGDAIIGAAIDALAAPRPADDTGPDRRSAPARRYDALVEVCRRQLRHTPHRAHPGSDDAGHSPGNRIGIGAGGAGSGDGGKAQVRVTIPLEVLESRLAGSGVLLDSGQPISAGLARRLACDAQLIPLVLGSTGEPLDVGRTQRLFTGARRIAIEERDRGCVMAGCTRCAAWCEVHHLEHWADGGRTSVEGGCLVCTEHHPLFDSDEWQPVLIHGRIWVRPPPTIDPLRRPRLNHHHRPGPLRS